MKYSFHIGQRVQCTECMPEYGIRKLDTGTVVVVESKGTVGVEWDNPAKAMICGHDLRGLIKSNNGLWHKETLCKIRPLHGDTCASVSDDCVYQSSTHDEIHSLLGIKPWTGGGSVE